MTTDIDFKTIKNVKILYIFSIISACIISTIFSILKFYNYKFDVVDIFNCSNNTNYNCYNEIKIPLVFFQTFYSILINFFILIHFSLIFFFHSNNISLYTEQLKENNYGLDIISQQFIEIKYNYNISVSYFNILFSISASCGFVSILFFLINLETNYLNNDVRSYLSLILFTIMIINFHIILNRISNNIKNLKQITANNKFMITFFERKHNYQTIDLNNLENLEIKNYIIDIENGRSIDWIIFNTLLNEKWDNFDIFGFDWDNGNILIKIISLILTVIIGKNII